jgi:hypothetical protein
VKDTSYSKNDKEKSKKHDSSATKNSVQSKANNLRSALCKELKKVTEWKRSGASAHDVYAPSLWYFDLLMCIKNTSVQGWWRVNLIQKRMWGKTKKRNSSATKSSIRSEVNNLRSAFRKELRKLRNEKEVVRLHMMPTHLHYGTMIHYCLLQTQNNPRKEFQWYRYRRLRLGSWGRQWGKNTVVAFLSYIYLQTAQYLCKGLLVSLLDTYRNGIVNCWYLQATNN